MSSAAVGSSRSRHGDSCASTRASVVRPRSPPESVRVRAPLEIEDLRPAHRALDRLAVALAAAAAMGMATIATTSRTSERELKHVSCGVTARSRAHSSWPSFRAAAVELDRAQRVARARPRGGAAASTCRAVRARESEHLAGRGSRSTPSTSFLHRSRTSGRCRGRRHSSPGPVGAPRPPEQPQEEGAAASDVITPSGSSTGAAAVRATTSARTTRAAPPSALPGARLRGQARPRAAPGGGRRGRRTRSRPPPQRLHL